VRSSRPGHGDVQTLVDIGARYRLAIPVRQRSEKYHFKNSQNYVRFIVDPPRGKRGGTPLATVEHLPTIQSSHLYIVAAMYSYTLRPNPAGRAARPIRLRPDISSPPPGYIYRGRYQISPL